MVDEVQTAKEFANRFRRVITDIYAMKNTWDLWREDQPYIRAGDHFSIKIRTTVPAANELSKMEIQFGDGTGPNGRDELFWSVDGESVARVEADSVIT